MTTGMQLKLARVAAHVKVGAVADQMGVTSSRISRIENTAFVTDDTAQRYRRALAACITVITTPEETASVA